MFIIGEKLLFTGTLAPRNGLNRYGFGTPTPNTCFSGGKNAILVVFKINIFSYNSSRETGKFNLYGKILTIPLF